MSSEDLALRQGHALYNELCAEDEYGDYEFDPYAEADQMYEEMEDR